MACAGLSSCGGSVAELSSTSALSEIRAMRFKHDMPNYGVFDENIGVAKRGTFIIDKAGTVRWSVVNPIPEARDIAEYQKVLADLA